MAKKSFIERETKRRLLVEKYAQKRALLKNQLEETPSLREKLILHQKIQKLPRNSARVRLRNRCKITGRPRGFYRDFALSRQSLREYAQKGMLPGVIKSSW
uniref:Small ribosomal subunit protein uS14c n=1 Tax=Microrhizoidea pickettheapsiorum TaxID=2604950 RepID=A0A5B9RFT9_9CHLO|nr:ribosomal protein S14 [Microrhizoidea pickettheapsiorum]QEG77711.1 ribosomal protein S14 [Microrhizoidea pickettheapsiorum]